MNTPNHMALQEALGYRVPAFAHLPIILNMDGSKMSKREKDNAVRTALRTRLDAGALDAEQARAWAQCDAQTFALWREGKTQLPAAGLHALARRLHVSMPEIEIHDFRRSGYLPEVLTNFIALLGWSPGEDREKMTLGQMCELFSLERVGKTNARFDRTKLLNFNTTALAATDLPRKLAALRDYLSVNPESLLCAADQAALTRLIEMNEGFRIVRDIEDKSAALFIADEALEYDAAAVQKVLLKGEGEGLKALEAVRPLLAGLDDWSPAALEGVVRGFCEQRGLSLGKVAQPLRVATTGTTVSPPIFDTLALLGKPRVLARIDRAEKEAARHG